MDQPRKVANPARGQLNRENEYFPIRVIVIKNGVRRREPGRERDETILSDHRQDDNVAKGAIGKLAR